MQVIRKQVKGVSFELFCINVPTFRLPEVVDDLNKYLHHDGEEFTVTEDVDNYHSKIQIVCMEKRYVKLLTKFHKKGYICTYYNYY